MSSIMTENVIKKLNDLKKILKKKKEYTSQIKVVDKLIEDISEPFNIMVMGEFSTGKSTFINALMGENLLKMDATPTTAVITKLCYGKQDKITVYFKDGTNKIYTDIEFNKITATEAGEENSLHKNIDYVERQLPFAILKRVSIIDSPGLNAYRKEDEKITREFMNNADTILLLFDVNQMNKLVESQLLDNLSERLKPIGIINKIDTYDEEEEDESIEEFIEENRVILKDKVSKLLGVSAKQALNGKLNNDQRLIEESNIKEIEDVITNTILENRDTYKFYSLLDKISEFFIEFSEFNNKLKARDILPIGICEIDAVAKIIYDQMNKDDDNSSCKLFVGVLYYYTILLNKHTDKAVTYIEESVKKNNTLAQKCLLNYCMQENKKQQIFYWSEQLAKKNEPEGQYVLGLCYLGNFGVEKNEDKAIKYLTKAGEAGVAYAQYELGRYYENNDQIENNWKRAVYWYQEADKQNLPEATYELAFYYSDEKYAISLIEKAAQQGYAKAQNNLGLRYTDGKGVEQNKEKAVYWFEQAAKQVYDWGQINLAACYADGDGVEKDEEKAFYWYEQAAKQGNAVAQYNLAICYDNGKGIKQDKEKAFYWYEQAANQGFDWGQKNLADCYAVGQGVEKNEVKAFYWYEQAAKQGNAEAQNRLGICYNWGKGIEQDKKKAIYWFEQAVNQGFAWAQYNLALKYKDSTDNNKINERKRLLQLSAEQDIGDAQYELALCYEQGKGTDQNNNAAFYWMKRAVDNNVEEARPVLGRYYDEGIGTSIDKEKADFYLGRESSSKSNDEGGCFSTGCGCLFWIIVIFIIAKILF